MLNQIDFLYLIQSNDPPNHLDYSGRASQTMESHEYLRENLLDVMIRPRD